MFTKAELREKLTQYIQPQEWLTTRTLNGSQDTYVEYDGIEVWRYKFNFLVVMDCADEFINLLRIGRPEIFNQEHYTIISFEGAVLPVNNSISQEEYDSLLNVAKLIDEIPTNTELFYEWLAIDAAPPLSEHRFKEVI